VNEVLVKAVIRLQRIAVQVRSDFDIVPHDSLKFFLLASGNDLRPHLTASLKDRCDDGLAVRAASAQREYSTRTNDLIAQSNVIDMLGLPTLNWPLLDRWHRAPDTFGEADFQKLRSSGISVLHPAVAFETDRSPEITRDWFGKWNRLIGADLSGHLKSGQWWSPQNRPMGKSQDKP
jgi:hypothetical protein